MDVVKIATFSALAIPFVYVVLNAWRNRTVKYGFCSPPGPRGLPLIGSVLDINVGEPWLTYTEWSKHYGGLISCTLLGQNIVIISDKNIADELLERRSSIYSSRPCSSINDLLGLADTTALLPYGSKWRSHRRMHHTTFNKQASMEYGPIQIEKAYQLLRNLIATPQEYANHLETFTGSVIMAITYGYDADDKEDNFISLSKRVMEISAEIFTPEYVAMLTAFPSLAYMPSWLPGGRHNRRVGECHAFARRAMDDPFNYVKDQMISGSARKSLVHDLLVKEDRKIPNHDEILKAAAATASFAGLETMSSVLVFFILAMTLFPEVQAKAQEEIDQVVGHDRLPDFRDRENLPYVDAILMETLRWHPVIPLGLPHTTTSDDVLDGMCIPQGSIILMNIWAITQDETQFPDPTTFKPERHLVGGRIIEESFSSPLFSIGRRVCPGRYVAVQSMWAAMACILSTIRITNAKDEHGNSIAVVPEFTTGTVIHAKPFPCSIEARSFRAKQLIHESRLCK